MHKRTNELNLIIELIYLQTKRDKLHREEAALNPSTGSTSQQQDVGLGS